MSLDTLRERARGEVVSHKPPYGWYEMNHPVESYMLHQGEKFVRRFDANTYLRILDAWQWFDLVAEAGAEDFHDLFDALPQPGVPGVQHRLGRLLPSAGAGQARASAQGAHVPVMWITVHSEKGHDSFLLEPRLFTPHLTQALNR